MEDNILKIILLLLMLIVMIVDVRRMRLEIKNKTILTELKVKIAELENINNNLINEQKK